MRKGRENEGGEGRGEGGRYVIRVRVPKQRYEPLNERAHAPEVVRQELSA